MLKVSGLFQLLKVIVCFRLAGLLASALALCGAAHFQKKLILPGFNRPAIRHPAMQGFSGLCPPGIHTIPGLSFTTGM
ncbi:hypothetical protein COO20_25110 [Thalassospira marina]|uniref:Uncharacterized protein n=1 Tax=Thalassospira marina TaxID=2048283 RepID=A0A2N3KBY3_9PROT|nr:hypothetical protein COO20_25110 [Thalassospira marina]